MKSPRKPLPPRRHRLKRSAVKPRNAARKRREFARAYGSRERVEWVKSLPCAACGVVGFSENAHVASGGAGRKADASQIVPLCGPHYCPPDFSFIGCHAMYDRRIPPFDIIVKRGEVLAAADRTEAAWQTFSGGGTA